MLEKIPHFKSCKMFDYYESIVHEWFCIFMLESLVITLF